MMNQGAYGQQPGMMNQGAYGQQPGMMNQGMYGQQPGMMNQGMYGQQPGMMNQGNYDPLQDFPVQAGCNPDLEHLLADHSCPGMQLWRIQHRKILRILWTAKTKSVI